MGKFSDLEVAPRFRELIDAAGGDTAKMESLLADSSRLDLARFNEEFDYSIADLIGQVAGADEDKYGSQEIAG